ncbi:MAG: hypothetical protein IH831_08470, partial [Planctomycetes bacterium]|nr:hypothetical protein [Planctomycetota bacterium]
RDLTRGITRKRVSDRDFRASTKLGEAIVDGGFKSIAAVRPAEILMSYENE